jgi:methionine-rich copper-binding protein CopC
MSASWEETNMPDTSTWWRWTMTPVALAAALVLGAPTSAVAHAILVRSSLTQRPASARTPTTVILQFDAVVNVGLSRVVLLTAGGDKRPLEIAPAKPGEILVKLPPLPDGVYGMQYRIMASDGHWTDEVVRFRVREQR